MTVASPPSGLFRRAALMGMCAMMLAVCAVATSYAQALHPVDDIPVELSDSSSNLADNAKIYLDLGKDNSVSAILTRYQRGDRPDASRNNLITIPARAQAAPFWLLVPVVNQEDHTRWYLHLGDRLNGRTGQFSGIFIYDTAARRTLFSSTIEGENGTSTQLPSSDLVPISLTPNTATTLMIYLQPTTSDRISFPLSIHPGLKFIANDTPLLLRAPVIIFILSVMTGFMLALSYISRTPWLIVAPLYLWSLSLGTILHTNTAFTLPESSRLLLDSGHAMLQDIFLILLCLAGAAQAGQISRYRITLGASLLVATIILALSTSISPISMPPQAAGSIAPILSAVLAIILYLQARGANAIHPAFIIIACLHTLALGLLYGVTDSGIFHPTLISLNAPIILSMLAFPLMVVAFGSVKTIGLSPVVVSGIGTRERDDTRHLQQLRAAKENFDYNNLIKVIEHERKQLAEARERESERTEEMRRAKDLADEANRAKSAFLAVISHEIRTPMTGIMGMVKLLNDSTLTKDQHDYVATIKESGNAMMSLLNDILDFEKIESGKMQLESIDFDLHRLVTSIATLMQGHATTKGVSLNIDIAPDVPQFVIGDMARLRQVLLNLVGNAIKFTARGSVTIRLNSNTDTDKQGNTGKTHQVYIAVQDSGIGISYESQKNIFNPFAQADKTISRKFGGSGLGLAISQRLVEAMGSQINLSSREGEGTTFFFTLTLPEGSAELAETSTIEIPSAPAPRITAPEQQAQTHDQTQQHAAVMVVEDNEITRRVLRSLLEQQGLSAVLCESGMDALAKLEEYTGLRLIITDIQMPGMSGYDLAASIRIHDNQEIAQLPIIALTGNVDTSDIEAAHEAGMNDHLAKPIDPDQFERLIAKYLNTSPAALSPPSHNPVQKTAPTRPSVDTPAPSAAEIDDMINSLDAASIFQTDMLDTLKESLGRDQLDDMLKGLYDKADDIITALTNAAPPYDFDEIRARAHELKGMSGNFGLQQLSTLALYIERQAKSRHGDGLNTLIKNLPARFAAGRQEISHWLDR